MKKKNLMDRMTVMGGLAVPAKNAPGLRASRPAVQVVVFGSFRLLVWPVVFCFFFQAEAGIRDTSVTGVQTCALPICRPAPCDRRRAGRRRADRSRPRRRLRR